MKRRNTADEDKKELPQEEKEQGIIYVYGHSKHNHPIASEGNRHIGLVFLNLTH
jgi:hypothetical protein